MLSPIPGSNLATSSSPTTGSNQAPATSPTLTPNSRYLEKLRRTAAQRASLNARSSASPFADNHHIATASAPAALSTTADTRHSDATAVRINNNELFPESRARTSTVETDHSEATTTNDLAQYRIQMLTVAFQVPILAFTFGIFQTFFLAVNAHATQTKISPEFIPETLFNAGIQALLGLGLFLALEVSIEPFANLIFKNLSLPENQEQLARLFYKIFFEIPLLVICGDAGFLAGQEFAALMPPQTPASTPKRLILDLSLGFLLALTTQAIYTTFIKRKTGESPEDYSFRNHVKIWGYMSIALLLGNFVPAAWADNPALSAGKSIGDSISFSIVLALIRYFKFGGLCESLGIAHEPELTGINLSQPVTLSFYSLNNTHDGYQELPDSAEESHANTVTHSNRLPNNAGTATAQPRHTLALIFNTWMRSFTNSFTQTNRRAEPNQGAFQLSPVLFPQSQQHLGDTGYYQEHKDSSPPRSGVQRTPSDSLVLASRHTQYTRPIEAEQFMPA